MNVKKHFKEIFELNPKQDPVIDAVRALSVLSIIAFHLVVGIIQIYDHKSATEYIVSLPPLLQPLWRGEMGVDAFFLISAFVLGVPLFKNIDTFNWQQTKVFYKKRFFRIYPLFLFALVLYTAGQWSYFGKYFFTNLLLINNLIPGERTIIPVGWSLLVEVQYYAVLPALLLLLKHTKHRLVSLLMLLLLSVVCCAAVLLNHTELYTRPLTDLFLAADHSDFSSKMGRYFYEADLTRFGPFVIGLILAYLRVFYESKLADIFRKNPFILIVAVLLFVLLPATLPVYNPGSWYYDPFSAEVNFIVLSVQRQVFAIGLALLVLGCWYSGGVFKLLSAVFRWRLWAPISRLSFPIYLFHFPFIAVAAVIVFGTTNVKEIMSVSFIQGASIYFLALMLTIAFSIPLYIFIERPLIDRGKKTLSGQ